MLPKPLYESLPYLYIFAGSGIILSLDGVSTPVGLLLYFFGAWLWMMRSERRRRSSHQRQTNLHKTYWSPVLYELQPFLYILVGLVILDWVDHPVRYLSGSLLIITGVGVWVVRASNRKAHPVDGVPPQPIRFQPDPAFIAGSMVPEVKTSPGDPKCKRCAALDICQSINLEDKSIVEIMRLNQTVSHVHAFPLFLQAIERTEGRRISEQELRPILDKMGSYGNLCAIWRKRGRHA